MGAEGLDSRTLAGPDTPEVGHRVVGRDPHLAAEGVDFAGNMALGWSADAAVARQMSDPVGAQCDAGSSATHPGARQGRFNSGMAGSNHHNFV